VSDAVDRGLGTRVEVDRHTRVEADADIGADANPEANASEWLAGTAGVQPRRAPSRGMRPYAPRATACIGGRA
jgi:hypothetical protein